MDERTNGNPLSPSSLERDCSLYRVISPIAAIVSDVGATAQHAPIDGMEVKTLRGETGGETREKNPR